MYSSNAPTQFDRQQPEKKPMNKTILIVIGVVIILFFCCIIAAAAIVFLDPFQLDLLGRISGKTDMAAQAMPEDTPLYIGVNLANFNPAKVNKIVKPFMEASGEFDENDTQGMIEKLDEQLKDDIGMTITDDVMPWIGQFVGIGFAKIEMNPDYGDIEEANFVIIAEARDKKKADDFIEKLIDTIEDENGVNFSEKEYKGVTIYTSDDEYMPMSICRSGSLVLLGTPENTLKDAIDAQKGKNLRKDKEFKELAAALPGQRGVTLYVNADEARDILGSMTSDLGQTGDQILGESTLEAWQNSAISLSLVDAGVKLDIVTGYDAEKLSDVDKQMLSGKGGIPPSVEKLPANTIMYIAGRQLNLVWDMYREAIFSAAGGMEDYEESMELLSNQIGFHLEKDLITYLDQDWAVALVPGEGGFLAEQTDISIGLVGLFGTSNEPALETTVGNFTEFAQSMGVNPENLSKDDYTLYEVVDPFTSSPMVAYGIGSKFLTIGTSSELLKGIFEGGNTLSKSAEHTRVWKEFPNNTIPVLYLNLQEGIKLLKKNLEGYDLESFREVEPYLKPIPFIAIGGSPLQNNITRATLIVFITQD